MIKRNSIAFKLIFSILISCTALFLGIFWYNYSFSKKIISENISDNAKNLTRATVNEIDSVLLAIQEIPENIASLLEHNPYDKDELLNIVHSAVEGNPEIYGAAIAFDPYAYESGALYFAPYYYRKKDSLEFTYLGSATYQYFYLDWYLIPKELQSPVWSEPYYDEGGGNILMATYSVPFYKNDGGKRKFMGVITADISLMWLQKMVSSIKIAKSGYAFLISKNGAYVTHPLNKLIMNETVFSIAEATNNNQLRDIGKSMIEGESGVVSIIGLATKRPSWLSYAPLSSSGWSLGIVFPRDELLLDITRLNRVVFILGFLGFVILFVILFLISMSITRPIQILADTTRDIGTGKLDFDLSAIRTKDEVGKLAESFVYMRESLKKYIKELTETTAVKERMQSELRIAHDIQMGIIPKIFPPFPDKPEFDIYGILSPAKEVGGDFYDFFFMDSDRLCFVVGDVSDKGVPASLLMAVTKTMIKTMSKDASTPDQILDMVNKEIAHDNDSSMFITIFCGILNIKTGEIMYSNGGHTLPLVVQSGYKIEFLKGDSGIAVGATEKAVYKTNKILLGPKDIICVYTDGITEALSKNQELFGENRLKEEMCAVRQMPLKAIILDIQRKVNEFSDGMPQADDITLLAIQYLGGIKKTEETVIALKNSVSEVPRLAEAVRGLLKSRNISEKIINEINLSLEEILANIIGYAYADKNEHKITVSLSISGSEFTAKIVDDGKPFNPLSAPQPDINASVKERKVGGVGLYFVRKLMDKIEYKRSDGKNVLILKKTVE